LWLCGCGGGVYSSTTFSAALVAVATSEAKWRQA